MLEKTLFLVSILKRDLSFIDVDDFEKTSLVVITEASARDVDSLGFHQDQVGYFPHQSDF